MFMGKTIEAVRHRAAIDMEADIKVGIQGLKIEQQGHRVTTN
jgi:hypothetical protein